MDLSNINPYIRFAEQIKYTGEGSEVIVGDCRIFYVTGGSGEIIAKNQTYGLQTYELNEKKLFFCREGSKYTLKSLDGVSIISLNFDLTRENQKYTDCFLPFSADREEEIKEYNKSELKNLNVWKNGKKVMDLFDTPHILKSNCDYTESVIYLENGRKYAKVMDDILNEFKFKKLYYKERAAGILKIVLIDLMRGMALTSKQSANAVSDIIEYITENYASDITNKELAQMAGYHEYHLNRLFVKQTGQSLHQYILTIRLGEAKRLMLMSDLSVAEIADRTGFNSCTHFSSYFKKTTGLTPYQYRRKFRDRM